MRKKSAVSYPVYVVYTIYGYTYCYIHRSHQALHYYPARLLAITYQLSLRPLFKYFCVIIVLDTNRLCCNNWHVNVYACCLGCCHHYSIALLQHYERLRAQFPATAKHQLNDLLKILCLKAEAVSLWILTTPWINYIIGHRPAAACNGLRLHATSKGTTSWTWTRGACI